MKTRDIDFIIAAWVRRADETGATESGSNRYTGRTFPAKFEKLTAGEVKERLGRKWRAVAGTLMTLAKRVDAWKPTDTARGVAREFYLSSLDATLVGVLGGQRNVANAIKHAKAVGMLTETRTEYTYRNEQARPKAYTYNPTTAALLSSMMEDGPANLSTYYGQANLSTYYGQAAFFDGGANLSTNREYEEEGLFFTIGNSIACQNLGAGKGFQGASKGFQGCLEIGLDKGFQGAFKGLAGSGMDPLSSELDKGQQGALQGFQQATPARPWKFGTHLNRAATDAEIQRGLALSYPWLPDYQRRAAALNTTLPPIFRMTFQPKIKRGKGGKVSKVGIRCHSPFCQTLRGEFRHAVLYDLGFPKVYEYDTKSSIYRISYFLSTGVWMENSVDFYEVMKPRDCSLDRETYKSLAQRLYFCHSAAEVFNSIKPRPIDPQGLLDRATMERAARLFYDKETERAVKERLETYWYAMRAIVTPYRSEIFLHESCLYLDLLEALTARGYKVGQVYDGFYSTAPDIEAACLSLLPGLAKKYLEKTGMKTGPEPLAMKTALEAAAQGQETPANGLEAVKVDNEPPTLPQGQETPPKAVESTPTLEAQESTTPPKVEKPLAAFIAEHAAAVESTPKAVEKAPDAGLDAFLSMLFPGGEASKPKETPKETPAAPTVSPVSPQAVDAFIKSCPWLAETTRPVKRVKGLGMTLEDLLADDDPAREA